MANQTRAQAQNQSTQSEKTITIPHELAAGIDTRSARLHTCAVAFDSAIRFSSLKEKGGCAALLRHFLRVSEPLICLFNGKQGWGASCPPVSLFTGLLTRPLFSAPAFSSAKAVI